MNLINVSINDPEINSRLNDGPQEQPHVIIQAAPPPNYKFLDGLRGIACLSVTLYHLDLINACEIGDWYFFTPLILTKKGV